MSHLAARHLALLTVLAVTLAGAPKAHADPSLLLADPGDFSGGEILLTFEDLGLGNGDDIPSIDGVEFGLSNGGAAKFIVDGFPREFDPQGEGSLNNFWNSPMPYPYLTIRLPAVVHRLGFALRGNEQDDVRVTLLSSGSIVDEMTTPNRGADQLYFYGFENTAGFDEVLVDLQANASGAFILDNLSFETLEDLPADGPPVYSCVGFTTPLEVLLQNLGHPRLEELFSIWLSNSPLKPLRARLFDEEDLELGDLDLIAAPVVQVLFTPLEGGETLDVTPEVTWRDSFRFHRRGYWRLALKRHRMREPGTYHITMESGDESEYLIDPTCRDTVVKKTRKRRSRRH
jgi:hypothetical protein